LANRGSLSSPIIEAVTQQNLSLNGEAGAEDEFENANLAAFVRQHRQCSSHFIYST
jgi:hypothetical protein